MGKRIICGCVVLGIVACLIGCQKSDNYELMKESKQQVLPIYEKKDAEVQGEKWELFCMLQCNIEGENIENTGLRISQCNIMKNNLSHKSPMGLKDFYRSD